jgi:uncharacterized protein
LEATERQWVSGCGEVKVGSISARFSGRVALSGLDPPNGYRIAGEGGIAGADKDGGTSLACDVEVQIGGKLAQLGQRLISGTAKKLADQFFATFAKAVEAERSHSLSG